MIDHIYNEDCLTGMRTPRTVDANSGGNRAPPSIGFYPNRNPNVKPIKIQRT